MRTRLMTVSLPTRERPRLRRFHHLILADISLLRRVDISILLASRTLSGAASAMLTYGAMVHLARIGASQLEVSLLSASASLAALSFGLRGGAVADSAPKRLALAASYGAQAALCIVIPTFVGTDLLPILLLIFSVGILSQITTPAIKAAVAIVASAPEVATVTVLLGVASGVGTAIGSAILAPILIKLWDIRIVAYTAAFIFCLAASRALKLPGDPGSAAAVRRQQKGSAAPRTFGARSMAEWLFAHQAVATMLLSGAIVTTLGDVVDTLQPVYVRTVLDTDPANTVYVFAPGAIGWGVGSLVAPRLVQRSGERWLVSLALVAFAAGMILFGLIDLVQGVLAPLSPLRLLSIFGIELSDGILAAGVIAILIQFSATCATVAVQTYVNRRVPLVGQGTTFGMQTTLAKALSIVATLSLGALATAFGVRLAFFLAPALVLAAAVSLIWGSYRARGDPAPPTWGNVFASYWDDVMPRSAHGEGGATPANLPRG
jgi:MFS family permease